jgi:hypothetical protein
MDIIEYNIYIFHNIIEYIWVNYNNSLSWNKASLGIIPLLIIIPGRSEVGIVNTDTYLYSF